jgi:hypothetical protein
VPCEYSTYSYALVEEHVKDTRDIPYTKLRLFFPDKHLHLQFAVLDIHIGNRKKKKKKEKKKKKREITGHLMATHCLDDMRYI